MIDGEYAHIRGTGPDDAPALSRLYDPAHPRAALLDARREWFVPTLPEIRELLLRQERDKTSYYTVEDREGRVQGFASLQGINHEIGACEMHLLMIDVEKLDGPLANEAFEFLRQRAFSKNKLNKITGRCLNTETTLRGFFADHGFQSEGVQRDVFFSRGRWHDLESLTLFAEEGA